MCMCVYLGVICNGKIYNVVDIYRHWLYETKSISLNFHYQIKKSNDVGFWKRFKTNKLKIWGSSTNQKNLGLRQMPPLDPLLLEQILIEIYLLFLYVTLWIMSRNYSSCLCRILIYFIANRLSMFTCFNRTKSSVALTANSLMKL